MLRRFCRRPAEVMLTGRDKKRSRQIVPTGINTFSACNAFVIFRSTSRDKVRYVPAIPAQRVIIYIAIARYRVVFSVFPGLTHFADS